MDTVKTQDLEAIDAAVHRLKDEGQTLRNELAEAHAFIRDFAESELPVEAPSTALERRCIIRARAILERHGVSYG